MTSVHRPGTHEIITRLSAALRGSGLNDPFRMQNNEDKERSLWGFREDGSEEAPGPG